MEIDWCHDIQTRLQMSHIDVTPTSPFTEQRTRISQCWRISDLNFLLFSFIQRAPYKICLSLSQPPEVVIDKQTWSLRALLAQHFCSQKKWIFFMMKHTCCLICSITKCLTEERWLLFPPSVRVSFSMTSSRFTFSNAFIFIFMYNFVISFYKINRFFLMEFVSTQVQVSSKLGSGDSCLGCVPCTNNNQVNNCD